MKIKQEETQLKLNPKNQGKKVRSMHIDGVDIDQQETANLLIQGFFDVLDIHYLSEHSALVLIENYPEHFDDSLLDLVDLFLFELNMNIKILIGNVHHLNENSTQSLFNEHRQLKQMKRKIAMFNPLFIQTKLVENLELENLFPLAFDLLSTNPELTDMVTKLWENNNNTAQSASELYIHRNTLIYRINKYQNDTNLDLKDPSDLLISYLIAMRILCKL